MMINHIGFLETRKSILEVAKNRILVETGTHNYFSAFLDGLSLAV